MEYKFKNLIIHFLYELVSIEDVAFYTEVSSHPIASMTAIIPEEEADQYIFQVDGETVIKIYEHSKDNTIFYGRVTNVQIQSQGGLHYMTLQAMGSTYLMDIERKSRTFFKKGITYKEIIQAVLKDYEGAQAKYNVKVGRKADFPIIQYQETDWEFIMRIASLFEAVLIPSASFKSPRFSIGVPKDGLANSGAEIMLLSSNKKLADCIYDYYDSMLCISLIEEEKKEYKTEAEKKKAETEEYIVHELDFVQQTVLATEYYSIGSVILVQGSLFFIESAEIVTYGEALYYQYSIKIGTALKSRYHGNPRISGISLVGTVKKSVKNQVAINLEIDEDDGYDDDREDCLFTYALETSAYYCMPVKGARVHLYFPSDREWEAIAVNSLRSAKAGAKNESVTSNPDDKSLTTPNGQALKLTPTGISVIANEDQTSIIKLESDGNITINGTDFLFMAPSIQLGSETTKSICMETKGTILFTKMGEVEMDTEHCVAISNVVQIYSKQKIWHWTYGTPLLPSVSYDETTLMEYEKNTALEQNEAIEQTLIARKQQARSKFGKGLLMVTIGTCLIVATGGIASGPIALAVGAVGTATYVFGTAEMDEGIQSYNLAMSGDWNTEAYNPLKEMIGEDVYNAVVNGLAITSSLIFAGITGGSSLVWATVGGSLFNTGFTVLMDFVVDGKIDMTWNDIFSTLAVSAMAFSISGAIGEQFRALGSLSKLQKFGVNFLKQFTASSLMEIGNGQWNPGENLFREGISSAVGALFGNCNISRLMDFVSDVGVEAIIQGYKSYTTGKPFDYQQLLTTAVMSGIMNSLFARDPVDTARGRLFVYEEDLLEEDLYGVLKLTRRYNSTSTAGLSMGRGWIHEYESFLYGDDHEVSVLCTDTHKEVFTKEDGVWINNKNGNCMFTLEQDEEKQRFYFTSYEGGRYNQKEYDYQGKLLSIAYHRNKKKKTILTYNEQEELTMLTTPGGKTIQFFYEGYYLVRVEDSIGRKVNYEYTNGYLTKVRYANGGEHTYQYDAYGNLIYSNNPTGKDLFRNEYDDKNRVVRQELADGNYGEVRYEQGRSLFYYSSDDRTEIYEYDTNYQVTKVTYGDGTYEEYQYDIWGNKEVIIDRNGNTTRREHNAYGQVIKEELPNGLVTEYTYNEFVEKVREKDNTGYQVDYLYDESRICYRECYYQEDGTSIDTEYHYDECARITEIKDANGHITTYEYDTESTQGPNRLITAEGEVFAYTYDIGGRNTEITSEYGMVQFAYNSVNKKTLTLDALGNKTRRDYDKNNNLIQLILPTGNPDSVEEKGYQFYYDNLERHIKTKNPLGAYNAYQLDGEDHIIKEIHPNTYSIKTGDGLGVTYTYDKGGRKIKEVNALGDTRRYYYDRIGNLVKVIEPEEYEKSGDDGKGYQYEYDKNNKLVTILRPDGEVEKRYVYDSRGRLLKEIDTLGYQSASTDEERYGIHYVYNAMSWLVEKREPVTKEQDKVLYHVTRYLYDKVGNKIEEKRGIDAVTKEEQPTSYHSIYFSYDNCNRLIRVTDSLSAAMEYAYDSLGNKTLEKARINEDKYKTTRYEYNKVGLLEKMTQVVDKEDIGLEPSQVSSKSFLVTKYQYDGNGNLTQIITPEGYRITREYDVLDQMILEKVEDEENGICRIRRYEYDKAGNRIREIDGKEQSISYTYDLANRQTHQEDQEGGITRVFYDRNGRVCKVVDAEHYDSVTDDGKGTTYTYDDLGRLVETRNALGVLVERNSYTPLGKVERREDAIGLLARYTYDISGRVSTVATASQEKEGKPSQSYTYDAAGHITGICDGEGNETRYELDEWGRITTIHKPDQSTEQFTYDYAGNIEKTTDGNGNTITYRYNSFNELGEIIDQVGNSEYFTYDKQGRRSRHYRKNGTSAAYRYNVDGRLTRKSGYKVEVGENTDGESVKFVQLGLPQIEDNYVYNEEGQLIKATGGGLTYTYEYTKAGRMKCKKVNNQPVLQYIYTKTGKVSWLKDKTGKETCYKYDALGRVVRITDGNRTIVDYAYNTDDTLKSVRFANGITTDYTYNSERNYASLVTKTKTGEELLSYRYQYDRNGNRVGVEDLVGGEVVANQMNPMNLTNPMNQTNQSGTSSQVRTTTYSYDSMQRLSAVQYPNALTEQYAYDNAGNRVLKRCGEYETRYSYNNRNQLVHSSVFGLALQREQEERRYEYDLQGNLLHETLNRVEDEHNTNQVEEKSYEYDTLNRTSNINIQREDEQSTQKNFYDAEDMRCGIEENGEVTNFITDGWSIVAELDKEYNVKRRLVRGYGIVASEKDELDSSSCRFYHTNEHTDVVMLTDMDGNIVNHYRYDAFGKRQSICEKEENRYGYTDEVYDNVTEQYYLRARYYNPTVARFTQEDEYRGDGLNLYAYCGSNPVMYADPSGYGCKKTGIDGDATSDKIDYKKVFFEQNPDLEGKVVVHHSVEQQVLKRYPGLFSVEEINAYDMLRGIPKEVNSDIHLSKIRKAWNGFYKKVDAGEISLSKENFLNMANEIDKLWGSFFNPPR